MITRELKLIRVYSSSKIKLFGPCSATGTEEKEHIWCKMPYPSRKKDPYCFACGENLTGQICWRKTNAAPKSYHLCQECIDNAEEGDILGSRNSKTNTSD